MILKHETCLENHCRVNPSFMLHALQRGVLDITSRSIGKFPEDVDMHVKIAQCGKGKGGILHNKASFSAFEGEFKLDKAYLISFRGSSPAENGWISFEFWECKSGSLAGLSI
jgi:hypothetical protein